MIAIEKFSNKYSNIFVENSELLQDRKMYPPAVIRYANTNKNLVLLAIENKQAIGFIIAYAGENKHSILTIYVHEDERNKKIGSLLVNTVIQQNSSPLWTVRLKSIDYSIVGFFLHNGFKIVTELNLYQKKDVIFLQNPEHLPHIGNFAIEVAEQRHIPQIMEIEKSCFDNFWLRTTKEWKGILEDQDAIVYIFVNEIDNDSKKIIGFSHNSTNQSNGSREGQYIRIAVDPAFRRAGIATRLTVKAFEYFKRNHVKKVYLSTVKENEQLNKMYQRWGFEYFDSDVILGRKC